MPGATHPDESAARVLALVEGEGYSINAAAHIVGVPQRTAWDWVQRSLTITNGNKPILDRWTRRVIKAQDLMDRGLDKIADDDTDQLAFKNLQTLNIIAGTGTDKIHREQEVQARTRYSQAAESLANAISRLTELPPNELARIIEGQAVLVSAKDIEPESDRNPDGETG